MVFDIFLVDAKLIENSILLLFVEVVLTEMIPLYIRYSKPLCRPTYIKKDNVLILSILLLNNCGPTEVGYG